MKKKMRVPMLINLSAVVLLFVCLIAACSSKTPDVKEIAQKIDNKEALTESDYSAMIDYCGEYAKKAQGYFDIINQQPNDSTAEAIKATSDMAALYAKYPYLDMFRTALAASDINQLGKANEKKVNEYAQFEAFPLPGGEGAAMENPNVVGMIEDMPSSDSAGVIANGDGEAVDINVK